MKNKSIILLTSFSLALSVAVGVATLSNSETKEAAAIGNYSTYAATYYNDITATSGKQLAGQLHDLITSTHRYYTSYADNGGNGYQKNTDRYYENDNPVSGYIYEFYSGVKWPDGWYATAGNTSGGYNREHCWCQSNSVNKSGTQMWGESGGGADMHHLRPVEVRLNSTRSNNQYGEISNRDSYKVYAKFGSNTTYALGGYNNGGTFEPLDSKKGDVARIILYTYLHYNSCSVNEVFGGYATTNGSGNSSYFSSSLLSLTKITNQSTEAKALEMLLSWNELDQVDDIETRRNNQVAVYQGNRNPFIDNSDYAERIWGSGSSSTAKVNSVSVSPSSLQLDVSGTKTGELTADVSVSNGAPTTVTWSSSNENVATVNSSGVVTAVAKGSCTITATSTYNENKSASCSVKVVNTGGGGGSSTDTASGSITAVSGALDGWTASGTGSYADGSVKFDGGGDNVYKTDIFTGDVSTNMTELSVTINGMINGTPGSTNAYKVEAVTSNGTKILDLTKTGSDIYTTKYGDVTFDLSGNLSGCTGIRVTYATKGGGNWGIKSVSWTATYTTGSSTAPTLDSISLNTSNVQTEFVVGDTFDYSGLVVVATYDNGTGDIVTPTSVSTPDMSTAGDKTVTVSYTEDSVTKTDTYTITVSEPEPTVDSVELDVHELELDLHGTASSTLSATVDGENNPPQDITWESSDTSVATVSDAGVVTAVAEGECIVTAYSTYDDEHFDTCAVTVVDSGEIPATDGTISFSRSGGTNTVSDGYAFISNSSNEKNDYYQDRSANAGLEIGIKKNSGNAWSTSPSVISLTVKVGGGTTKDPLTNNVIAYLIDSSGNKINSSMTVVTSKVETTTGKEYTVTMPTTNNVAGVLICHEKESNYNVRIYAITLSYSSTATIVSLSSITLDTENVQKQFFVGDTFTYEGLVVTAHYSDESSSEVTPTSVSSPDMTTAGEKTITVTYTEDEVTKTATYTINVEEETASSISAGTDKVYYHPGEIITKSNITVTDDLDNEITNFDFDDYVVTYEDAPSGDGSEEITLENAITYGNLTCDLQFYATREMYQEVGTVSDTLNKASTGNPSSYTSWSGVNGASGAVYAGHSSGSNESIQLRSQITESTYNSGIVTTSSSKNILSVTVTWEGHTTNGRVLNVYGSNTAYSSPNDLYDSTKRGTLLGTIVYGTSTKLNVTGDYKYVGVCSAGNAMYLTDITFEYADSDTATNVSNFIMYEDAKGQCVTKFDQALDLLNTLSSAEKELFWNSDDYVISHARERLQKWAIHEKVTLSFIDDEFVANSNKNINLLGAVDTSSSLIIVLVSLLSISSIAGYFLMKRKKEE